LYLTDDLPAELDKENRGKVCSLLRELGGQLFITGTDQEELVDIILGSNYAPEECKLFHVKHGKTIIQIRVIPRTIECDPQCLPGRGLMKNLTVPVGFL